MVTYEFDAQVVTVEEMQAAAGECEFQFRIHEPAAEERLKALRSEVENNRDLTDVVFGTLGPEAYQAIVRPNFRVDFLLLLFKYELLHAVKRI